MTLLEYRQGFRHAHGTLPLWRSIDHPVEYLQGFMKRGLEFITIDQNLEIMVFNREI